MLGSAMGGFLVKVEQWHAQHLSSTLLQEVKSSGRLWHETPVISLCRSDGLDFGDHTRNCRRDRKQKYAIIKNRGGKRKKNFTVL